jgi:hypothetical protein
MIGSSFVRESPKRLSAGISDLSPPAALPAFPSLLSVDSLAAIQSALESFLGQRFSIQINRGTSSLFKWSVIVGLQNRLSGPPLMFDHGRGDSDDMLDAIFDACTAAARLYPNA